MIERVHIQNFRCIRDLTLDLEPLTVLVGANASGKSTVLAALKGAMDPRDVGAWGDVVRVSVNRANGPAGSWAYRKLGVGSSDNVPSVRLLQLDIRQLRAPNVVTPVEELGADGSDLANVLGTIPRRRREELARQFCELVPMYADVDLRPYGSGQHHVVFQEAWDKSRWFSPDAVSDGTMLALAMLLLTYQSASPEVLAIEELERGLHPVLLGRVVAFLRGLTTATGGRKPTQVVLATQSADLLEHVLPDEVRFLSRDPTSGEVRVQKAPTESPDWAAFFRTYDESLGAAWLSGSLGGVPAP